MILTKFRNTSELFLFYILLKLSCIAFKVVPRIERRYANPVSLKQSASYSDKSISNKAIDRFESCTVLLTGATGGLGRSIAFQFASNCNLNQLILIGRNQKKLDVMAGECNWLINNKNYSTIISTIPCDLSDIDAVKDLDQEINNISISSLDVFIHAAGVSSRSRFVDTNICVDQLLMNVNFLSGAMLSKIVVPGMIKKKFGIIAWISGIQGFGKRTFDFMKGDRCLILKCANVF